MARLKKRKKKKFPYKFFLILGAGVFSFSYFLTSQALKLNISNEEFLRLLLSQNNPHIDNQIPKKSILNNFLSFISSATLKKPSSIIKNNYTFNNYSNNSSDEQEPTSTTSEYIYDPYPEKKTKEPIVYLYNTHQLEEYQNENTASYNITPNVMMASYILREKLEEKGIPTIVEENNVSEIRKINNWNYAASYKVTKLLMEDAYSKNPTLQYFIDVHRDSVKKNISTVTINDKNYARVLFIVGLENPNYPKNLEITTAINDLIITSHPNLSRGIYKKQGSGVNGVYNQDFHENTILIEIGAHENTIDEVYNTIEVVAAALEKYIGGKNE
ncbi:MAG: stage II sporulation protein P [bacterium]|nr:stage II sporulation protein P [bacterium]